MDAAAGATENRDVDADDDGENTDREGPLCACGRPAVVIMRWPKCSECALTEWKRNRVCRTGSPVWMYRPRRK
jgi:hypothetical protein